MKLVVRDALNNINRLIQEQRFIDISDNKENILAINLKNKSEEDKAEIIENLELICKEISQVKENENGKYTERYYYLSPKFYIDIEEFKRDFLII